jgi:hypothetical protein
VQQYEASHNVVSPLATNVCAAGKHKSSQANFSSTQTPGELHAIASNIDDYVCLVDSRRIGSNCEHPESYCDISSNVLNLVKQVRIMSQL